MAARALLVVVLPLLLPVVASSTDDGAYGRQPISRRSFPNGFVFGTASSSYQYEGGAMEGGRGSSIWDNFTHQHPGINGDVAVDSYHLYKEDVRLMKDMGMDAYRFSISWTRILPDGTLRGGVNREGIKYYNNLIDELLSKGLQPFVTLFHWDSPQGLEDKYGGFLSPNIINDYKDFAEVCFREFGDRVKHWITLNEPSNFCNSGYAMGVSAPGRCSPWEKANCSAGDSGREPYTVCHHQILSHAAAARSYTQKYKRVQKGEIGITLVSNWFTPLSGSKSSVAATRRAIEFMVGWFLDPLSRGDYPRSMKVLVRNRLPQFTKKQSELVKGAFDFIGINYYTTNYAGSLPPSNVMRKSYSTDAQANLTGVRNGVPIGPQAASPWLYVYPQGIDEANNKSLPLHESLNDDARIDYHHRHLDALLSAIRDGANVKGYFAWSLLDDFEWSSGYTVRFGLHFVDYDHGLKRYPKRSAGWFKKFLNG
ncbi:Beta-glucosidase 12 [Hordeum vulgare]|nr:Beta-glucosidase 12 [Hordeum vulgare]